MHVGLVMAVIPKGAGQLPDGGKCSLEHRRGTFRDVQRRSIRWIFDGWGECL